MTSRRVLLVGVAVYVLLCVLVVGWDPLRQRLLQQDDQPPADGGTTRVVISTPDRSAPAP